MPDKLYVRVIPDQMPVNPLQCVLFRVKCKTYGQPLLLSLNLIGHVKGLKNFPGESNSEYKNPKDNIIMREIIGFTVTVHANTTDHLLSINKVKHRLGREVTPNRRSKRMNSNMISQERADIISRVLNQVLWRITSDVYVEHSIKQLSPLYYQEFLLNNGCYDEFSLEQNEAHGVELESYESIQSRTSLESESLMDGKRSVELYYSNDSIKSLEMRYSMESYASLESGRSGSLKSVESKKSRDSQRSVYFQYSDSLKMISDILKPSVVSSASVLSGSHKKFRLSVTWKNLRNENDESIPKDVAEVKSAEEMEEESILVEEENEDDSLPMFEVRCPVDVKQLILSNVISELVSECFIKQLFQFNNQ